MKPLLIILLLMVIIQKLYSHVASQRKQIKQICLQSTPSASCSVKFTVNLKIYIYLICIMTCKVQPCCLRFAATKWNTSCPLVQQFWKISRSLLMLYDKIEIQEGVTYAKFSVGYNPNDWYIQHFFSKNINASCIWFGLNAFSQRYEYIV